MSQPIDKGVITAPVEQYPSGEFNNDGSVKMKTRYAKVGRATLWPSEQGKVMPNIRIELDCLPIGHQGKLEMSIFWDSESQNSQVTPQQQPAPGAPAAQQNAYQQAQGGYQQR